MERSVVAALVIPSDREEVEEDRRLLMRWGIICVYYGMMLVWIGLSCHHADHHVIDNAMDMFVQQCARRMSMKSKNMSHNHFEWSKTVRCHRQRATNDQ